MNPVTSLESGCFNLLTEALDSILIEPGDPSRVCDHICEQLRKVTSAKAVALIGAGSNQEPHLFSVRPSTWKKKLDQPFGQQLQGLVLQTAHVSLWTQSEDDEMVAPLLRSLEISNGLAIPLLDGATHIGTLLALGVQAKEEPIAITRAMQPLSKVLGLLLQDILLLPQTDPKPVHPASEGYSRAIFDAVNDAIMVHERDTGAILDVNQRMCEMFGLTYDEALWMDMGSLSVGLPPCTQDDALGWMRKTVEEGPQTFEWIAKHKSGRLFWIEINLRQADIGGHRRVLATIREITERKRTETEQISRLKRSEAQNAVFLALTGAGLDYESALELIAHHLAIQVGDLCALNILDEETGMLRPMALDQPYIDGRPLLPDPGTLAPFPLGTPGAGEVASHGEVIQIADPTGEKIKALTRAEFHPYLDHFGAHSLLIVAMRSMGKVIGTITLARCSSTRTYSAEDQAMIQNLADRSALTLVNARLYSENLHKSELLRQANAELEQRVADRTAELEKAMQSLHRMAVEDTLTGIANRRRFNEVIEEEFRRARRAGTPLSLLMCDVDFFKRYNDRYGHQGGDDCLRMVGKVLQEAFRRAGELPARYGGEEFAVVLPGVDQEKARQAGEKLRQAIQDRAMPHEGSDIAPCVTVSIGVSTITAFMDGTNTDWLISRADEALYRSKAQGRNRVVCS